MKKVLIGFFAAATLMVLMAITAFADTTMVVSGTKNYLALRTTPTTQVNNEIGKLYEGDLFVEILRTNNNFAYGYNRNGQYGFVNGNYLRPAGTRPQEAYATPYQVVNVKNYLAIRSQPNKNASYEIGRMFNGQIFYVLGFTDTGFAYGVSPDGLYGYVDAAYLR